MKILIFVLIVFLLISFNQINGQNENLSCEYRQKYRYINGEYTPVYSCELDIQNPNGYNNFSDISGVHMEGKTDSDVQNIDITYPSYSFNSPSIICEKFKNLIYYETGYVTEVNDYSFRNCLKLQELRIYFNVRKIYKNAFTENLQLRSLSIDSEEISTLPIFVFPKAGNNLTNLNLSFKKMSILRPEWFRTLVNLENLYLGSNIIEEVPLGIFTPLKKLKGIAMDNTRLKILSSKSFYDVSKLESFSFMSNHLMMAIDKKFVTHPSNIDREANSFHDNYCVKENRYGDPLLIGDFEECLDNIRAWEAGCTLGNTNERICKLERSTQEIFENMMTKDALRELQEKLNVLTKENQDLKSKMDIMIVTVQAMQNQINLLSNRT